jgi:hypothetical protein
VIEMIDWRPIPQPRNPSILQRSPNHQITQSPNG